jgi:hypothetical protein
MWRKQNSGAEAVWRERLAKFESGNLTVADFCRREGVSNPSFYQWRKRLKQRGQQPSRVGRAGRKSPGNGRSSRFLPVNVSGLSMAEIELPNGIRIRVPATNADVLRTAILAGSDVCQEALPC